MSTPEQQAPALPVGETIDRGFALLRRHPRALLLPQLVLNLAPLLVAVLLVLLGLVVMGDVATRPEEVRESTFLGDSELVTRDAADYTSAQAATLAVLGTLTGVVFVWFLIAAVVSVVRAAERALDGREHPPLRPAVRDALREAPGLFGLGTVFALITAAALGLGAVVVVVVAQIAGGLAVLAGVAVVAALAWAGVRVGLWPLAHLRERTGLRSYRRAWTLTRGRFWPLVGVVVLAVLVVSTVSFVAGMVLQLAVIGALSLDHEVGAAVLVPYVLFSTLGGVAVTAGLVAPLVVAYRTLAGRSVVDR